MRDFKYLIIISMISVSLLNIAMLFTYRLIEIGPFLVPGGVIVFPLTYVFADIVAEVYGYKNARLLIWGNFICILVFNITARALLHLPASSYVPYDGSYHLMFEHSLLIVFGYSMGFACGDFLNAYAISKLGAYWSGRYFVFRSIASSVVGQIVFSVIVSLLIYSSQLEGLALARQFLSTIFMKIIIITIFAYPSYILVLIIRRMEKLDVQEYSGNKKPALF